MFLSNLTWMPWSAPWTHRIPGKLEVFLDYIPNLTKIILLLSFFLGCMKFLLQATLFYYFDRGMSGSSKSGNYRICNLRLSASLSISFNNLVAKLLNEEAGQDLGEACNRLPKCEVGSVVVTDGFMLPARCKKFDSDCGKFSEFLLFHQEPNHNWNCNDL